MGPHAACGPRVRGLSPGRLGPWGGWPRLASRRPGSPPPPRPAASRGGAAPQRGVVLISLERGRSAAGPRQPRALGGSAQGATAGAAKERLPAAGGRPGRRGGGGLRRDGEPRVLRPDGRPPPRKRARAGRRRGRPLSGAPIVRRCEQLPAQSPLPGDVSKSL